MQNKQTYTEKKQHTTNYRAKIVKLSHAKTCICEKTVDSGWKKNIPASKRSKCLNRKICAKVKTSIKGGDSYSLGSVVNQKI